MKQATSNRKLESKFTSIQWYAPGQSRQVEVNGQVITVQMVGRKGRRARIAITALRGAVIRCSEGDTTPTR